MGHLSDQRKAAMADCSCPLPKGRHHPRLSKAKVIVPLIVFGLAVYFFWAIWPPVAICLLAIYALIVVTTWMYRFIRGHTMRCSLLWSPIAALYIIAEAVTTVFTV